MNESLAAYDWVAARGDKWLAQLPGMEAMLAPVDGPLIRALRLDAPCRIADIGCGGGGTALELLRRAPAGSAVQGFDISPALIEAARARRRDDETDIGFSVADVATAAPPEEPYDRLVSRFGIMFFDDPPAAFANLRRWLAPGGRLAFAAWGRPAENPWMSSVRETAAEVVELQPPDPEAPGPFRYAEADKLRALLDAAGFDDLDVRDWHGRLPIGGGLPAAEAAHFALTSNPIGEQVAGAGEQAFEAVLRSLTARFSQHQQDAAVRMDAHVQIFTGARRG